LFDTRYTKEEDIRIDSATPEMLSFFSLNVFLSKHGASIYHNAPGHEPEALHHISAPSGDTPSFQFKTSFKSLLKTHFYRTAFK